MKIPASGGGSVSRWSRLTLALATGCAGWLGITGCVSQDTADTVNRRLHNGMSTPEFTIAYGVAPPPGAEGRRPGDGQGNRE